MPRAPRVRKVPRSLTSPRLGARARYRRPMSPDAPSPLPSTNGLSSGSIEFQIRSSSAAPESGSGFSTVLPLGFVGGSCAGRSAPGGRMDHPGLSAVRLQDAIRADGRLISHGSVFTLGVCELARFGSAITVFSEHRMQVAVRPRRRGDRRTASCIPPEAHSRFRRRCGILRPDRPRKGHRLRISRRIRKPHLDLLGHYGIDVLTLARQGRKPVAQTSSARLWPRRCLSPWTVESTARRIAFQDLAHDTRRAFRTDDRRQLFLHRIMATGARHVVQARLEQEPNRFVRVE